jgi:2-methylcitrate dehydratase PrpD
MTTQLESLAKWVENISLSDVPPKTVEQAKLQVLDCITSINAGYRSNSGKKVYNALKNFFAISRKTYYFPYQREMVFGKYGISPFCTD